MPDERDEHRRPAPRLTRDPQGRVVVHKEATGQPAADRIAHEARLLRAARHPGVVEILDHSCRADQAELTTAWAGTRTLTDLAPLAPQQAASLVAALAETVADLHELGIVHGRIEPSHVVVDANGAPLLCGFAEAHSCGDVREPDSPPALDSTDVAALGRLLVTLIGDEEQAPAGRGRIARHRELARRRSLLAIAATAMVADASRRPSARALAAAVERSVNDPRLPGTDQVDAVEPFVQDPPDDDVDGFERLRATVLDSPEVRPHRRALTVAVVVAGVVATVAASWAATTAVLGADRPEPTNSSSADSPAADPVVTDPVVTDSVVTDSVVTVPVVTDSTGPGPTRASPAEAAGAQVPVVEHDGRRFELGMAGDRVLLSDWTCTGQATAAVVRPSTGEVFVFDTWAATSAGLSVRPSVRLPDSIDPSSTAPDPQRCGILRAINPDGSAFSIAIDGSQADSQVDP